jgi:hypothetical protein
MSDLNRATEVTPAVKAAIDDMFQYHPWDKEKERCGGMVRGVLIEAVRVIIAHVPPGPDRTVAIRKLREARMDCNSAITHGGKY